MLKFHYVRMAEPALTGPTWAAAPARPPARAWASPAAEATYRWLCGAAPAVSAAERAPGPAEGLAAICAGSEVRGGGVLLP